MKVMNIVQLALLSLVAIFMQSVDCRTIGKSPVETVQKVAATTAQIEQENMGELAVAFAESKVIIGKATEAMNNARELLLSKDATQADDLRNVKTIIEQNKIMVLAQQKLEKMRDDIAKKVEKEVVEQGYWNRFVAGVKNVGSNIASFFTRTEEEKATARLIAKGLTDQEVKITEKYALLQKNLEDTQKAQLKGRYDAIIAPMEAAIYEQEVITGDAKSSMIKRGLLLGASAAAGSMIGTIPGIMVSDMMLKKYFGKEGEIGKKGEEIEEEKPEIFGKSIIEQQRERKAPTFGEIGTAVGQRLKEAAQKTDVSEAMRKEREARAVPTVGEMWGAAKEYFTGPGQPAQKEEDIEGVTLKDLLALKNYIVDRISKALSVESEVAERLAEESGLLEGFAAEDYAEGFAKLKEAAQETNIAEAIRNGLKERGAPTIQEIIEAVKERAESAQKKGALTIQEAIEAAKEAFGGRVESAQKTGLEEANQGNEETVPETELYFD